MQLLGRSQLLQDVSGLNVHSRLEGGIAEDVGMSSSASRPRFRVAPFARRPRFAADILGRSGELWWSEESSRMNSADKTHLIEICCAGDVVALILR